MVDKTGLVRQISSLDREFYKTWTNNWGFTHEQILLAAETAKDKTNPMTYLNKVIANLNEQGANDTKTIKEKLKEIKPDARKTSSKPAKQDSFEKHNYSIEQLNAVFTSLDDVEI